MSQCNDTEVPAILMWGGHQNYLKGVSEREDQIVGLGPHAKCVGVAIPQFWIIGHTGLLTLGCGTSLCLLF